MGQNLRLLRCNAKFIGNAIVLPTPMVLKLCVATAWCVVLILRGRRTNKTQSVLLILLMTVQFSARLQFYQRILFKCDHGDSK